MAYSNRIRLRAGAGGVLACALLCAGHASAAGTTDLRAVDAARAGDFVAMKAVLHSSNVNARENDGSTALLWAAYAANFPAVRELIAAGADVNAANEFGITPLLQACKDGADAPIVAALLKAGAQADSRYRDGETALMAAAYAGDTDAVQLLLQRHADPNAFEQTHHQTALMWAAEEGHLSTVKLLLSAGAKANVAALPSSLVDPAVSETFGTRAGYSRGGLTPLMFAAREGHTDVVEALLAAGADINAKTPDKITPMMLAVMNDRLDMAKMLLDRGAHANDGSLNLVVAMRALRFNSVENSDTRPAPKHDNTITPIQFFGMLADHGASVTQTVHYRVDSTGLREDTGEHGSAYEAALKTHDVELLRLMLTRKLVSPDSLNGPKSALALNTSLLARDALGLFRFGSYDYRYPGSHDPIEVTKLLLSSGADVNAIDPTSGERPIHIAAEDGNLKMIQFLADHGAKLDAKNKDGFTPVELAMGRHLPGAVKEVRLGARLPEPHPKAVALLRQLGAPAPVDVAVPAKGLPPVAQADTHGHSGASALPVVP